MRIGKRNEKMAKIYSLNIKRHSQSQRRFVRSKKQVHNGDNIMPYISLSAANRWLEDDIKGNLGDIKDGINSDNSGPSGRNVSPY